MTLGLSQDPNACPGVLIHSLLPDARRRCGCVAEHCMETPGAAGPGVPILWWVVQDKAAMIPTCGEP